MGLCQGLLTRLLGPEQTVRRRYCTLLLLFVLFPLAGHDFGQREHLLFALVFPYVLLVVCRAEGQPVASPTAFLIGFMAGLGLALKPFFFAFWLLLEGWLLLRRRLKMPRLGAEHLAIVGTSLVYLLAVIVWTPEYFDLVRRFAGWQRTYLHQNLQQLTVFRIETWLTLSAGLALIALWPALWFRPLWWALWISAVGCLVSAVLQGKGFGYHYYPAMAFGMMLLGGLAAAERVALSKPLRRMTAAAVAAGALTITASTVAASFNRIREGLNWRRTELGQVISFVRTHAVGNRVFLLNSGLRESVIAAYSGARPVSRLMHIGALDAAYREATQSPEPLRYRQPEDMGALERYVLRTVVSDFKESHPLLLIVRGPGPDRPDDPTPVSFERWGRLDYIAYFSRDPEFAHLFQRYTFAGTIGHYHAYRPLQPGEMRVPPPPRFNSGVLAKAVQKGNEFSHRLRRRHLAPLLFLISFCLLAWTDSWPRTGKDPQTGG